MNTERLAKIFLDDQPIELADARPKVSTILVASGKAKDTNVQWLRSRSDSKGKDMQPEDSVDRTAEPTTPIYLTSTVAASFGRSAGDRDTSEGGVAPVPKGGSGPARRDPAGEAERKPDPLARKEAPREQAGKQKKPRDPARERQDPPREKGPRADGPARNPGPAAKQDD